MKTIFKLILAVMVCGLVLVNCGGCGNTSTKTSTEATVQDQLINEFDKFMDDYVSALKKAMTGDAEAMTETERLGMEYADLMRRFELAGEASFTEEQKERIEKIAEKFATAFQ